MTGAHSRRRHAIVQRFERMLDVAFPNHTDRSDYGTDYCNFRWMVD